MNQRRRLERVSGALAAEVRLSKCPQLVVDLFANGSSSVFYDDLSIEPDCNGNGVPDWQDIADGTSQDGDGIPDECEGLLGDLNCDGAANAFDIDPFALALTSAPGFGA